MAQKEQHPTPPFFYFSSVYALGLAFFLLILDIYSLYGLQQNRHFLGGQASLSFGLLLMVCINSLFFGGFVGFALGCIEDIAYRLGSPVRLVWSTIRNFLILLAVIFHWLSTIIFDTTRVYITHLPINPTDLMPHSVRVLFDRTMRSSLDVLFRYYSSVHVFVTIIIIGFLFALHYQVKKQHSVVGHIPALLTSLVVLSLGAGGLFLPRVLSQKSNQKLCHETTLGQWLNPFCPIPAPPIQKPQPSPKNKTLLNGYALTLASKKRNVQTNKETPSSKPSKRPHILLLLMESVSARHVGVYGYKRNTTPHLDKLSKQCVRFQWGFSNSNITKFGISSVFASRVGVDVKQKRVHKQELLFPFHLQKSGYKIGLFAPGYQFEGIYKYMNTSRWDRFFDMYSGKSYKVRIQPPCHLDCHASRELAYWWKKNQKKGPLFAAISLYSTHFPYRTPPIWGRNKFTSEPMRDYSPAYFHLSTQENVIAHYDNAIRYVDFQQKIIIDDLKRLSDRKLYIIIVSDHGEDLYAHGDASHGTNLYNSQTHIPFLLCGPDIKPSIRKDNVSLLDVAPTALHLAGVPQPSYFQGKNLLTPPPKWPRPIMLYNKFIRDELAMLMGPFKLIHSHSRHKWELYNIHRDPNEQKDIRTLQPEKFKALRWIMKQQSKSLGF